MRCQIIFIGESFRFGSSGNRNRDSRQGYIQQKVASFSHNIFFKSLAEKGITVSVIIATYKTKYEYDLKEWYKDWDVKYQFYHDLIGIENLANNSIKDIENIFKFDFIFVSRIDLFLKKYFINNFNPFSTKITFPSICWVHDSVYKNLPRVNDTMLFIPKQYFDKIITKTYLSHEAWYYFQKHYNLNNNDFDTMLETYHDSDSEKDYNPLYYIVARQENHHWHSPNWVINKETFLPMLEI
jgi:hypothetical protein